MHNLSTLARISAVVLLLCAVIPSVRAQNSVEYPKVLSSRSLHGRVVIENTKDALEGVLVEDCGSDWQSVNQTAHTDNTGHFVFPSAQKGVHFLRFSMIGMQTVKIAVRVSIVAPKSQIRVEMPVAN